MIVVQPDTGVDSIEFALAESIYDLEPASISLSINDTWDQPARVNQL
jgi:hypothetical protein